MKKEIHTHLCRMTLILLIGIGISCSLASPKRPTPFSKDEVQKILAPYSKSSIPIAEDDIAKINKEHDLKTHIKQVLELPLNQLVPAMKERIYSTPLRKMIPPGGLKELGIYHINTDQLSDISEASKQIREFLQIFAESDPGMKGLEKELQLKLKELEGPLTGSAKLRQKVLDVNALIDKAVDKAFENPKLPETFASKDTPRFIINILRSYLQDPELKANFVNVPPGHFQMGSPLDEKNRWDLENLHKVQISHEFELQDTDVTQLQWYQVMGYNPSYFRYQKYCNDDFIEINGTPLCPNNPVERISWNDVQFFIKRINSINEIYTYRLPTEAEWEYASRAGSTTLFYFGNDAKLINRFGWCSGKQTYPVGTREPNKFGLYDMHGNVWKWMQDFFEKYPTDASNEVVDPVGPGSGPYHVFRGCAWYTTAQFCRSAFRDYDVPTIRFFGLGFRMVRTKRAH